MLDTALKVLNIIEDNSYEAYIVGGFVRDYIMGIKSNDVDITTNAKPKDLIKIFPNANVDNELYGSVTIYYNNIKFEITTYRKENYYLDNRHPLEITYVNDLITDLKRRDFTINAICMDKKGNIIDLLDFKKDINKRIIRTVIDPMESFATDALRILRAVRFATTLKFELSSAVVEAIKENKYLFKNLSIHRKKEELDKIFSSVNIDIGLNLLKTLNLEDVLQLKNLDKVKNCSQVIGVWTVLNVDDIYPFTRNELQLMKEIRIVMNDSPLSKDKLYYYGLYVCSVAAEILGINKRKVMKVYKSMNIHKRSDILIDSYDIMNSLNIKEDPILSDIWKVLEKEVLNGSVDNERNKLLFAVKRIYTNLVVKKEELNEREASN